MSLAIDVDMVLNWLAGHESGTLLVMSVETFKKRHELHGKNVNILSVRAAATGTYMLAQSRGHNDAVRPHRQRCRDSWNGCQIEKITYLPVTKSNKDTTNAMSIKGNGEGEGEKKARAKTHPQEINIPCHKCRNSSAGSWRGQ